MCYFPERGNSESFCEFIKMVRKANDDGRTIMMILDNCRIHKTAEVFECAEANDVRLCFLPPYSPQFNPIEYIWKTVKHELSKYGILSRHQVESVVNEVFMQKAESPTYSRYWIDIFMDVLPKSYVIDYMKSARTLPTSASHLPERVLHGLL